MVGDLGTKGMFYLTMHSSHFYLNLCGVVHVVKDHSDDERENPSQPLHGLVFSVNSKKKERRKYFI